MFNRNRGKEISKGFNKRVGHKPLHECITCKSEKPNEVKSSGGVMIVKSGPSMWSARHVTITSRERTEELKAMKAYKKKVTKSPESANAFLKRIGAFDIK